MLSKMSMVSLSKSPSSLSMQDMGEGASICLYLEGFTPSKGAALFTGLAPPLLICVLEILLVLLLPVDCAEPMFEAKAGLLGRGDGALVILGLRE